MPRVTTVVAGPLLAKRIDAGVDGAVEETAEDWVCIRPEKLPAVARFLHDSLELDGRYLNSLAAVDCYSHFEIVYHLTSLSHNHLMVLKVRAGHQDPEIPSVVSVWQGARLQEREAYDLMGIRFRGHANLKRLLLWEGFPGHPLRKDFMELPGGFKPGLRRFPNEDANGWGGEFRGG